MTIRTTVDKASPHLRELLQAALRGEDVLIADHDDAEERVHRLVAVIEPGCTAEFGSGKGLFRMAENFDEPLPDFDEYQ